MLSVSRGRCGSKQPNMFVSRTSSHGSEMESAVVCAAYEGSEEQHVQRFLDYFRRTAFAVSLVHQISSLSSDLEQLIPETPRHRQKDQNRRLHHPIPVTSRASGAHICRSNTWRERIEPAEEKTRVCPPGLCPQLRGHMAQIPRQP